MIYDAIDPRIIVAIIVLGVVLIAGFVLLYIFVISRNHHKKQVRDLERKYSYLDALLIGQDSQYIHRLEIISRTNLLYVDKYEEYSLRFKEIYDNDDRFAESSIRQLNALINNKQYKHIKIVINDTKKAIGAFEEKVNRLDEDLYKLIKPEEDSRQSILQLKETYRRIKQNFYSSANEIDLISTAFIKVFDKLDASFADFETLIESAEYDEAQALIPVISKVIVAIEDALNDLPNLCIFANTVIPEKIEALTTKYKAIEKQGLPLYNLGFAGKLESWNASLNGCREKLSTLNSKGVMHSLEAIENEIANTEKMLDDEVEDKNFFLANVDKMDIKVNKLQKSYLKLCAILPGVRSVYLIEDQQNAELENLKEVMNKLDNSKRTLDNFIHSSTKQPYSTLKNKLDDLSSNYDIAYSGILNFKTYLDSLKKSSEEAYNLVFIYFYHAKNVEMMLREANVPDFSNLYTAKIDSVYNLLNEIDKNIKVRPINVAYINEKVEELKGLANNMFDEIENKCRSLQLAESAIVYANRDRSHQAEVNRRLLGLEKTFFEGDFETVYHDANGIYKTMHVEGK